MSLAFPKFSKNVCCCIWSTIKKRRSHTGEMFLTCTQRLYNGIGYSQCYRVVGHWCFETYSRDSCKDWWHDDVLINSIFQHHIWLPLSVKSWPCFNIIISQNNYLQPAQINIFLCEGTSLVEKNDFAFDYTL